MEWDSETGDECILKIVSRTAGCIQDRTMYPKYSSGCRLQVNYRVQVRI